MNAFPKIDVNEATRLTREGRLEEAMAILRGGLSSVPAPAAPPTFEGGARERRTWPTPSLLDMVPPSPGSGGA